MTVSFIVTGVTQAVKFLNQKKKNTEKEVSNSLKKVGLHMQNEVKMSIAGKKAEPTSVDTGHFMGSVDFNYSKIQCNIFSPVPYAKFLEHGTSKITARRHFGNSLDRNKAQIKKIMEDNIKNI